MHSIYHARLPIQAPKMPQQFSFSLLSDGKRCPRRWWLIRAKYDEMDGSYPQPPIPATISGKIVHGVLAEFAKALQIANYPDVDSESFRNVRQAFPIRNLVRQLRQAELDALQSNPRANLAILREQVSLDKCINSFKALIHEGSVLGSVIESSASNHFAHSNRTAFKNAASHNMPVPVPAMLPEVPVSVHDPPILGKIDLISTTSKGDTIVEYKTGKPAPSHEEQSRFYALLWFLKTQRIVLQRKIIYGGEGAIELSGLDKPALDAELNRVRDEIQQVLLALEKVVPEARVSMDECSVCPVRQLCDAYWENSETDSNRWNLAEMDDALERDNEWHDLEIRLTNVRTVNNGFVSLMHEKKVATKSLAPMKIFCPIPAKFNPGIIETFTRLRLLGVSLQKRGQEIHIGLSRASEFFWFHT